jgi:hypothetical protein
MRVVGAMMQLLFTQLLSLPLALPPLTMCHCSCYAEIVRRVCPKVTDITQGNFTRVLKGPRPEGL